MRVKDWQLESMQVYPDRHGEYMEPERDDEKVVCTNCKQMVYRDDLVVVGQTTGGDDLLVCNCCADEVINDQKRS